MVVIFGVVIGVIAALAAAALFFLRQSKTNGRWGIGRLRPGCPRCGARHPQARIQRGNDVGRLDLSAVRPQGRASATLHSRRCGFTPRNDGERSAGPARMTAVKRVGWVEPLRNPSCCLAAERWGSRFAQPILQNAAEGSLTGATSGVFPAPRPTPHVAPLMQATNYCSSSTRSTASSISIEKVGLLPA